MEALVSDRDLAITGTIGLTVCIFAYELMRSNEIPIGKGDMESLLSDGVAILAFVFLCLMVWGLHEYVVKNF